MKIAQELRAGSTVRIGNDPFVILKAEYNKSGRNAAVMKYKMKNLLNGNISDAIYKADDKMDDIRLDKVRAVYSYNDGDFFVFSNPETWDQIELKDEDLGDAINYLEEGMELEVVYYESTPVAVELPTFVERQVTYTEPGLRGDTSGKVMKPAKINTGFEIQVPLFVEQDEWIKIDTRSNEYVERIKK
ncbi:MULTISPECIES: elongation factor P [Cetobacterium]|jgi:elongation factor P|uniref:Elongation factor P n=1 Tax=Candidatus Cetobacterium colombiensis TaxID=3073100 RepID=A0ABU4WCP9_9FUSO|nr:elongation factor P [Candidatus Cetobacterium colombiensis]MDX8336293.1 elongation factor P [Candidatus Cetobacterium colombiensis]